ncbi:MAG: universal stress protein [Actinomycetota bacterium]
MSALGYPYYERLMSPDLDRSCQTIADAIEQAMTAGLECDGEILEGDAADEIVSLADNRHPDLIVIGSRGHGALAGALLGSVSAAVVQHAHLPVLVAKQLPVRHQQVAYLQRRPIHSGATGAIDIVVLTLTIASTATAFATGLGVFPVFFMGSKAQLLRPILLVTSIGAMTVASVIGLLRPALQHGGTLGVAVGLAPGGLLLLGAKALL